MIPLNKPGYLRQTSNSDYLSTYNHIYHSMIFATAGDGLNMIYRTLKEQYGKMKIGVSPFACFQAIYPIVANGHTPVFIDINRATFNMDTDKLLIHDDLDAVEVIHLGGNPNEMNKICSWAAQNNNIIIEDCAQAMGASFANKQLGTFGEYAVYSLIKNLHTIAGGLVLSKRTLPIENLPKVSNLLLKYREIKKLLESHSNNHNLNPWNWAYWMLLKIKEKGVPALSTNIYMLDDSLEEELRKAINNIEVLNKKRLANASYIISHVNTSKYTVQATPTGGVSNRNRLLFSIKEPLAETTIKQLRKAGIAANNLTQNYLRGFQPHISKDNVLKYYYQERELKCYNSIFNHVIAVPCSPFLTYTEMNFIINTLNQLL